MTNWIKAVARNGLNLEYAPEEARGDREVVLAAVGQTGWALEYGGSALDGQLAGAGSMWYLKTQIER